jgi:hypothetical protein
MNNQYTVKTSFIDDPTEGGSEMKARSRMEAKSLNSIHNEKLNIIKILKLQRAIKLFLNKVKNNAKIEKGAVNI